MKHGKEDYYGEKSKKTFCRDERTQAKYLAEDVAAANADLDGGIAYGDFDYF